MVYADSQDIFDLACIFPIRANPDINYRDVRMESTHLRSGRRHFNRRLAHRAARIEQDQIRLLLAESACNPFRQDRVRRYNVIMSLGQNLLDET